MRKTESSIYESRKKSPEWISKDQISSLLGVSKDYVKVHLISLMDKSNPDEYMYVRGKAMLVDAPTFFQRWNDKPRRSRVAKEGGSSGEIDPFQEPEKYKKHYDGLLAKKKYEREVLEEKKFLGELVEAKVVEAETNRVLQGIKDNIDSMADRYAPDFEGLETDEAYVKLKEVSVEITNDIRNKL